MSATAGHRVNRIAGWIAGILFLAVGVLGFTVSGGHAVAGTEGGKLLGVFEVNVLHNLVHLAVGAVLVLAAMAGERAARAANTLIGAVYLAVGVLGLFLLNTEANILALNGSDNALHLIAGALLLVVGLFTGRRSAR